MLKKLQSQQWNFRTSCSQNRVKFAMVPFAYSGTEGRSCSQLLRSPTELKRRTRSFSQHSLSNAPQTPPFFYVLPVHYAIPLLTDSPAVSTTHLGRIKITASLQFNPTVLALSCSRSAQTINSLCSRLIATSPLYILCEKTSYSILQQEILMQTVMQTIFTELTFQNKNTPDFYCGYKKLFIFDTHYLRR